MPGCPDWEVVQKQSNDVGDRKVRKGMVLMAMTT